MKTLARLRRCTGFDWDEGNVPKIWEKHQVSTTECEQVFFNLPLLAGLDEKHSLTEKRYYLLGQTDTRRRLFIVATIRGNLLRVISGRDIGRKERKVYEAE